jgi:hypothetical protein
MKLFDLFRSVLFGSIDSFGSIVSIIGNHWFEVIYCSICFDLFRDPFRSKTVPLQDANVSSMAMAHMAQPTQGPRWNKLEDVGSMGTWEQIEQIEQKKTSDTSWEFLQTSWKLQSLTLHISSVQSCSGEGSHDSKTNDSVEMIHWYSVKMIQWYIYIYTCIIYRIYMYIGIYTWSFPKIGVHLNHPL